ncbi:hypothetical protein VIGAN_01405100 [Vigna angularis var. angularis]|uniref:Uncharacterized protein n=1 Tax=Vigna angularis var. angularis TaxID=157739 RepID=A0A0S3R647_PHAAN|nr:hypothetical protein VIGAN_01405100 [Vigna angularis var. angularis]
MDSDIPYSVFSSNEERTIGIKGSISNLLVAKIFSISIAHADLPPLLHYATKALLHYLLHRILNEILIVLSFRKIPQIQRITVHIQTLLRMLQLPAVRLVPGSDEGVRRDAEVPRHVVGVDTLLTRETSPLFRISALILSMLSEDSPSRVMVPRITVFTNISLTTARFPMNEVIIYKFQMNRNRGRNETIMANILKTKL